MRKLLLFSILFFNLINTPLVAEGLTFSTQAKTEMQNSSDKIQNFFKNWFIPLIGVVAAGVGVISAIVSTQYRPQALMIIAFAVGGVLLYSIAIGAIGLFAD